MIDPVSIGIAFAAAQTVVNNIKSAVNTGKDIYSITKDIGKFLHLNANINKANAELKLEMLNRSSEELEAQAFEAAMLAHQINEQRTQLKDLLYWSGNAHIWDGMVREHTRLLKEKREMEERRKEQERLRRKQIAEILFTGVMVFCTLAIIFPIILIILKIYLRH